MENEILILFLPNGERQGMDLERNNEGIPNQKDLYPPEAVDS
jgi:hypothetical protein